MRGRGVCSRGRKGKILLNGYRVSAWNDEKFWKWWLHNIANTMNATELYTSILLKSEISYYIYFITITNSKKLMNCFLVNLKKN